jgi:hypothetical protein
METSKTPKGSFTIFHLWWVLCVFLGFGWGIAFGATRYGWIGGVLGAIVGLIVGVIVGWLPWFLAFMFLPHIPSKRQPAEKIES